VTPVFKLVVVFVFILDLISLTLAGVVAPLLQFPSTVTDNLWRTFNLGFGALIGLLSGKSI